MANLIDDVLDFLESEVLVAGATGWTRAASWMPPDPDQIVAVYETPGTAPEQIRDGSTEQAYDDVGFQVRIRGAAHGYEAAREQIGKIYRALHGSSLAPATGDPAYLIVHATQSGPMPLGLDENERPGMTWNFRTMRERT